MAEQPFTGSLKPGVMLDKYEVREQLAAGGMAIIYKAYDPTLDRYVAIKQIAPHLASDEKFAVRFRTEAQTLARLSASQPNIVHVHELIQQEGQLYLVMECVEGTTLRTLMDRGPVPLQTGLGILLSTALGLRAMHAQGIVHRDLTPANVMMAKDGALKITDFGLIGHSGGRTSLPMGTTKYMAPEMFTGMPVDPRADLYSLGMIAYEMFAGPEKFGEAFRDVLRDEKAQQVRWMHWHSNAALRVPPLKDLQPGIPPLVSKIVERMMDKDPAKRFATADQIVRWLRRIFVMNVQGKSISVADSESLEKEIDTEAAAAPTAAAVRPGAAVPAGAEAGAESPDKTAPIPKPKWTLKRTAFWASVTAGPLIALCAGFIIYKYNQEMALEDEARQAQRAADSMYDAKRYTEAAAAYARIVQDYPKMEGFRQYAMPRAQEARAEQALLDMDWSAADEAATAAEKLEAPHDWVMGFRKRFGDKRDIEENMAGVEALQKAGKYEEAIELLINLAKRHPELKPNDKIAVLQDKIDQRVYRSFVDQGRQAFQKQLFDDATAFWEKAREKRETPEIVELLKTVATEKKLADLYARAEKAADDKRWADAYTAYKKCLEIRPSEVIRAKMNKAAAEDLLGQARTFKENGLLKEAADYYVQVLQYDPQNAEAKQFLQAQGQKEKLDAFIKAGDEAMKKKQWPQAIASYAEAEKLLDPKDTALKEVLDGKIAEAGYNAEMEAGDLAMAQKKYDDAIARYLAAQKIKDTDDVKARIAEAEKKKEYWKHYSLAMELLGQSAWLTAQKEALAAKTVDDTPEVRDLLKEIDYRRYFAQGKVLLSQLRPREALATFKMARYAKDTMEIQGYIKQATDMIAAQEKVAGANKS